MDYLAAWRAGDLDVELIVSSERETADAVARVLGVPGARHADFFVGGEVVVLEFDVPRSAPPAFAGRPLAEAGFPEASRVVSILRDGGRVAATGGERILPGDRLIVMASRASAREWGALRHLLLFRLARRELDEAVHPDAVVSVRVGASAIDDRALRSAVAFVVLYVLVFALGTFALALDARLSGANRDALATLGAAAACLGNVGPAFGVAGPFGSYASFGDLSTAILTGLMVLGRLEIVPLVVLLRRTCWRV